MTKMTKGQVLYELYQDTFCPYWTQGMLYPRDIIFKTPWDKQSDYIKTKWNDLATAFSKKKKSGGLHRPFDTSLRTK